MFCCSIEWPEASKMLSAESATVNAAAKAWLEKAILAASFSRTSSQHRSFSFAPELGRRSGKLALEGTVECGFGSIADARGNFCNAVFGGLQKFGAEFHAPLRQIGHRRFIEEMSEAIGKGRAREPGLPRKACNGPLLRRVFVQMS